MAFDTVKEIAITFSTVMLLGDKIGETDGLHFHTVTILRVKAIEKKSIFSHMISKWKSLASNKASFRLISRTSCVLALSMHHAVDETLLLMVQIHAYDL